jgi:hypothetical protein
MSIINEIKYQVRIQAGHKLHEHESVSLEVWCDARIIQDYTEPLLVSRRIIEDQIDEDLEYVYI